jgi:hypothetical protein
VALPDPSPDTTVLITGASAGIGAALARELAARGHGLTLVARRREPLDGLAAELRGAHGVTVDVHTADVASDADRARLLRAVHKGRAVAGVCNNAGTAAFGPVVEHDAAHEELMLRTNVVALFELTNRLVRDMVARGAGAILNLGSIVAFAPFPQNATYAATKAFIASYSEALHTELRGTGVSCTTLSPGPTRTGLWEQAGEPNAPGFGGRLVWQEAEDVAREAVEGMVRGRRTVTPGWTNKLAVLGYRYAPRSALLPGVQLAQGTRVRRLLLG